jgi:hypothetical protein
MRHGLESKRIWSAAVALALLATGIVRADVDYSGGNGKTLDRAVVISGANNLPALLEAERYWINDHYDNVEFRGRMEQPLQGSVYDAVYFSAEGRPHQIFFQVRSPGQD